jgi:hypothetical protein
MPMIRGWLEEAMLGMTTPEQSCFDVTSNSFCSRLAAEVFFFSLAPGYSWQYELVRFPPASLSAFALDNPSSVNGAGQVFTFLSPCCALCI